MGSMIPFDGLFGDSVLDHFFDDVPTIYKDYVAVPKDEEKHYIRHERGAVGFQRQFTVKGIKEDGIKASLKDGVLKIALPKEDQKKVEESHRITIE